MSLKSRMFQEMMVLVRDDQHYYACSYVAPVLPTRNGIFPNDSVLVSEILEVEVTMSCDILEPITIKLQHCIEVTEEDEIISLAFAKSQRNHPHDKPSLLIHPVCIFKKLKGSSY